MSKAEGLTDQDFAAVDEQTEIAALLNAQIKVLHFLAALAVECGVDLDDILSDLEDGE